MGYIIFPFTTQREQMRTKIRGKYLQYWFKEMIFKVVPF